MTSSNPFSDIDVVANYLQRPAYPPSLIKRLVELAGNQPVLDLGSGPGKLARQLAPHVVHVTALDCSSSMIDMGQSLPGGQTDNIDWIVGDAERIALDRAPFGLIVAGQSIQYMNNERAFANMRRHINARDHVFAVVEGDAPFDPPWKSDWDTFMQRWTQMLTGTPRTRSIAALDRRFEAWLDGISHEDHFVGDLTQSIDAFIAAQHSRRTFSHRKLGTRVDQFNDELRTLLEPHAVKGDAISFRLRSRLSSGRIRKTPRYR